MISKHSLIYFCISIKILIYQDNRQKMISYISMYRWKSISLYENFTFFQNFALKILKYELLLNLYKRKKKNPKKKKIYKVLRFVMSIIFLNITIIFSIFIKII